MAEFFTVITDAGREAVAKATQAGEKVNITHMAVGDGGGSAVTPNEEQTQLVNECWRGLVSTYKQEGTSIIIDTYIPADEESFTVREMGVFTADGVLFAVCNTPEMRKVLPSEGAVGNFTLGMEIDVTNIDMSYIEIHTNPELDFIPNSEKGQPNGVPILDENGKIPADNMPANTPTLGEDGKIPQEQLPDLNFDTAGSAAAVQGNLNAHINNKQNPHGVTAAQVGAYDKNQSLTSATAGLFGLSASAVPNDVLAKIKTLIDSANSNVNIKANIQTGSYIGTGTFGSSNRNSLTFNFSPKLVLVVPHNYVYWGPSQFGWAEMILWIYNVYGITMDIGVSQVYRGRNIFSLNGNTLFWYMEEKKAGPADQCNESGRTYDYFAIG